MTKTNLIEPCCAERQMPRLLREGNGVAQFLTMGDVTMQKMYQSVACLSGSRVVIMVSPTVTDELLKPVKTWMRRGWTERLRLLTADVEKARQAVVSVWGEDARKVVEMAHDKTVEQQMIILQDDKGVLNIAGPLLTKARAGLAMYSMSHKSEADEIVKAVESRIKMHLINIDKTDEEPYQSVDAETQEPQGTEATSAGTGDDSATTSDAD